MSRVFVLAAALVIAATIGMTLPAAPAAAQSFYTGNWEGKVVMRGKTFTRCEIWVEFVSDRRLYFAQLDNDSVWISIGHPQWKLDPNTRSTMEFRIYSEQQRRDANGNTRTSRVRRYTKQLLGTVVSSRPNQIWFSLRGDVKLLSALQTSDLLYIEDRDGTIEGQRKTYGFRLNDVRSALLKLSLCKLLYSTK